MDMLLTLTGFILAFIVALYYQHKIKLAEARNKVHFYVARDKSGYLYLHIGKPFRDRLEFSNNSNIYYRLHGDGFKCFGLNENDYTDLKWEDEPVEVFVNMED